MRDHRRLRAFQLADELALVTYELTRAFPDGERFGLVSQLRRAAVATASDIVEGSARHSDKDYLRFLDAANGSARELEYQLSLAHRLGFLETADYERISSLAHETCRVLAGLLRSLRRTDS